MRFELPTTAVLRDLASGVAYSQLQIKQQMALWQELLLGYGAQRIALAANSSAQWALLDLACLDANLLLVPLPTYLSESQCAHVMAQLEPDIYVTDQEQLSSEFTLLEQVGDLLLYRRELKVLVQLSHRLARKLLLLRALQASPRAYVCQPKVSSMSPLVCWSASTKTHLNICVYCR